ncbi:uncharacterized mitochondrial protein-like protein [Tanacetum coccineum]
MDEPKVLLKKKDQISLDEEMARNLEAQRLQAEEQGEITIEERSRLFVKLMNKRKKHFAKLEPKRKEESHQLKLKREKLFDNKMKRVNTFIPMDSEVMKSKEGTEESSKRIEDELESNKSKKAESSEKKAEGSRKKSIGKKRAGKEQKQESSKRQRMEDDKETDEHEEAKEDDDAEMKNHMEVVQDNEEIVIDVIPLATKPLIIVDYKIVKEGQKGFYHLIRADGSSNRYSSMIRMVQNISREDLETLWKLVKTKHGNTRPEDDYEKVLWGSSSSLDSEIDSCSKSCVKAYATLKEQYDSLYSDYKMSQFNLVSYKAGLESVEARLAHYKKNEKLEKAEKERDELKLTLEKFQNSSKALNNLLESQVIDKFKNELGYNAASSIAASSAVESFVNSSEMLENQENNNNGDAVEPKTIRMNSFRPPFIEDWNSDDESEVEIIPKDKTVSSSTEKIKFVKSARETVEKVIRLVWNNSSRVNHKNFANKITRLHPNRRFVPQAVPTRSGKINTDGASVNTVVRPVNTAGSKIMVKDTTARDRALVSENKGKGVNAVKASACWGNQHQKESTKKKELLTVVARHITGNKCYLTEYEDYDGGFVSFGDGKGRISGKGKIKTGTLDFDNVYFCKELKYNLLLDNVRKWTPTSFLIVDSLTISMNCVPVVAETQTNGIAGTRDSIVGEEDAEEEAYCNGMEIGFRYKDGKEIKAYMKFSSFKNAFTLPPVLNVTPMDDTGIFCNAYDDEDVGAEADLNNLETTMNMDVKSAFLYGTIDEEVYVCQPLGFEDPQFPDKVYKVEKALYGLHQAPRAWDFVHRRTKVILVSTGLQSIQKKDGIFISQDKYVADILKKFDFATVKTASTPMEPNKALIKDEEADSVDVHLYRSMIGSLMYLTASRPDITFAVCACARFQVTPKTSHLHAVKRIFRYLKGQPKLGLWYPRDSPFDLEAFSDSDYAGASLDRKSTTGGCQFLGKRLISWQCKKQTIVANSTTEKASMLLLLTAVDRSSGPINLVADETVYREWEDRMERAATTASSLDAKQDSDTILGGADAQTRFESASKQSNDPPLSSGYTLRSGEDNMKLLELMELCTKLSDLVSKKKEML